jgi:hypothetical protein
LTALIAVGCGGSGDGEPQTEKAVLVSVDGALLAGSWPIRMAEDANRAVFESSEGWRHVFQREYPSALRAFAENKDAMGLARIHQEMADIHRQGALLAANATIEAYGVDRQDADPLETAYILGVSAALRGEKQVALEHLASLPAGTVFSKRAKTWIDLIALDSELTLEQVETVVGSMGDVVPGTIPNETKVPHFQIPERTDNASLMSLNDPTDLMARALWHSAAGRAALPESERPIMDLMDHRYAIQKKGSMSSDDVAVDDTWLFCSSLLAAADAPFIAAVSVEGVAAVEAWASRSVLAAALLPTITDGQVNPQAVLDTSVAMQKQVQRHMADVAGQKVDFHRPFAQFSRIAVLQAGMIVADANDQYRDAGILRLEALERMESVGIDPVFAISVAAWDAGNRNPMRPEDLLHTFSDSFPSLTAARSPLEALHLRRSRTAAPTSPVH